MWLLEWPVEWPDGNGYDRHHQVFEFKERALANGELLVRQRCSDEPRDDIEMSVRLFRMEREREEHYCAGVTVKPVVYFSGVL